MSTPRKLLTSARVPGQAMVRTSMVGPSVPVRPADRPLNIAPSTRVLPVPVDTSKSSFAPSAPRKTAGRKRRGHKGRARRSTKTRKATRRR